MTEKQMIVQVHPLRGAGELAPEDRGLEGAWGITLTGQLAGRADPKEAALDVFHLVVPVSVLEDFEIDAAPAGGRRPGTDLGRFSRLPDPPFANRLLEEAFGAALRRARPDTPAEAIVYEVDGGEPGDPNTVIRAAVFDRGILDATRMIGEPISLTVSKAWLADALTVSEVADEGPES
jgi:hypothetical protein